MEIENFHACNSYIEITVFPKKIEFLQRAFSKFTKGIWIERICSERRSQMLNVNGNSERNALLDSFSMNMRYPLGESSHPYCKSTTVDLLQTRYRLIE